MRPISELKMDFEVSQSLGDIVDVLKSAAMIQFRSFQLKDKPNTDLLSEAESCFNILFKNNINHPYLFDRKSLPSSIAVITSDEGFLGEMNTLLINASIDQRKSEGDEIVVLGERGARYLDDVKQKYVLFPGISDETRYKEVERLKRYLLNGYRRKFGRIIIIYPRFMSLTSQRVTVQRFLPFQRQPGKAEEAQSRILDEILIEPSVNDVLSSLIEVWLGFVLSDIFWSSKQSEFGARIMHLEGSTQELGHMKEKLSFEYFRQVHALRDKVIREISASKIMLGKKAG